MNTEKTLIKRYFAYHAEIYVYYGQKKRKAFSGSLKELLSEYYFVFRKRKTDNKGIYRFTFQSETGITFVKNGIIQDIPRLAKLAIQMEMVRLGGKSSLFVYGTTRPTVTINF